MINNPTEMMYSCSLKIRLWEKRRAFLGCENTHMRYISADHHTKEDGPKEELSILQDNLDDQLQKNTKICVRRDTTPFVGIITLSTHMT